LGQIQAGADFDALAFQYDPLTGGDLSWFPRGYLTQASVEEAGFALQPGEISSLIHTDFGYHILKVIERDAAHPLAADARQALQRLALLNWLEQQKAISTIDIYLP
jgi:peptidyl-prolyl cis-trans isomerase C